MSGAGTVAESVHELTLFPNMELDATFLNYSNPHSKEALMVMGYLQNSICLNVEKSL